MPAKGQEYLPVPARPATAFRSRTNAPLFARAGRRHDAACSFHRETYRTSLSRRRHRHFAQRLVLFRPGRGGGEEPDADLLLRAVGAGVGPRHPQCAQELERLAGADHDHRLAVGDRRGRPSGAAGNNAAVSGDLYSKPATLLVIAAILLVVGIILTVAGYRAPAK